MFTQFVTTLYSDYDLEGALAIIKKIKTESETDVFIATRSRNLVNSLYTMLFETYCSIYSSVEIKKVSEWVELSEEDSEIWIVSLARRNNLGARFSTNAAGEKVLLFKGTGNKAQKEVQFNSLFLLFKSVF